MEYAQVYRLVMDLLDQMVELLGDEPVKMEEFLPDPGGRAFGDPGGTVPRNVDRVVAGDVERTRLTGVKALFFIGANDGYIPKAAKRGGLLPMWTGSSCREAGWSLRQRPGSRWYMQRLYLYMNMTKALLPICSFPGRG